MLKFLVFDLVVIFFILCALIPYSVLAISESPQNIDKSSDSMHELIYDKSGNLINDGINTYFWNSLNRLIKTVTPSSTITYTYDHKGVRLSKVVVNLDGSKEVIIYPFPDYTKYISYDKDGNVISSSTSLSVNLGNLNISTVENKNGIISQKFNYSDHLGSSKIVTDDKGIIIEEREYDDYGKIIKENAINRESERKFTNHFFDNDTDLTYMGSRYYDQGRGQFISQDPKFWVLPNEYLIDPQQMNSYAYARNNPINNIDPDGEASIKAGMESFLISLKSYFGKFNFSNFAMMNSISAQAGIPSNNSNISPISPMQSQSIIPKTWDKLTDERIALLDVRIRIPAANFINEVELELGKQLRINSSFRSFNEQDQLFSQGRTKPGPIVTPLKGGQSYHNFGLAFDAVEIINGKTIWKRFSEDVLKIAEKNGFEVGARWAAPYTDNPHFQKTFGKEVNQYNEEYLKSSN